MQMEELENTLGLMGELGYIAMEEVPGIPTRETPFKSAVYAPLSDATGTPDVVIISGTPRQMMLLAEAATAAGIGTEKRSYGTTDVCCHSCRHTRWTECEQLGVYRQPRLHRSLR